MAKFRFDEKTRNALRKRLRELGSIPTTEAVKALNEEGFRRPCGSNVTEMFVNNQRYAMGLRAYKKKKSRKLQAAAPKPAPVVTKPTSSKPSYQDALLALIMDKSLPKEKRMIILEAVL